MSGFVGSNGEGQIWCIPTKRRKKIGGYRQNGEKNLVELSVKRIFAHKSEDKWKIM